MRRAVPGLTQADVASMAQISLPALGALERGEGSFHALIAVTAVLGVRWGWAPGRAQAATALAARHRATGLSQAELVTRIGVTCRRLFALASGRFAMIDDGIGFKLVLWTPSLERHLGQHVSGVARGDGGVDWSFGRKRGLGLWGRSP